MAIDFPVGLGNITYEYDFFCLAENTPLLNRRDGHINLSFVENLIDGDEVLSLNRKTRKQEWKRIKVSKNSAPKKVCRLQAGTFLDVTHTHKMLRPDFLVEAAGNLEIGNTLLGVEKVSLPETLDSVNLCEAANLKEEIDTTFHLNYETGALVGLYLAKGYPSIRNSFSFIFYEEEEELSSFVERTILDNFNIKVTTKILSDYSKRLSYIHQNGLSLIWKKVFNGDSSTKYLPSFVFAANKEFKLGLIHGWLWGDGDYKKGCITGTSRSNKLSYGIHNLALSLGISNTIVQKQGSKFFQVIFDSRKAIDFLFPEPTIWKYDSKIREYIENPSTYSKKQLEDVFKKHYIPGMSSNKFYKESKISSGPFIRIYGSWNKLLLEYGYDDYIYKHNNLDKTDFTLIAYDWLVKNNWSFSIHKWDTDPSVPSQGEIYKFFNSVTSFLHQMKWLTSEDIEAMRNYKDNNKEEYNISFEKEITVIDDIPYSGSAVYDIRVEDNENFLIGGLVSHNSGNQSLIYFEDVLVDDAVRIAWNCSQQRTPIYGYASQYFNALSAGVVIGSGSLWVAYKEAAYIPVILRYICARRSIGDPMYASPALAPRSGTSHHSGLIQSAQLWQGDTQEGGARQAGIVKRADIERIMRAEAAGSSDVELQRLLQQYQVNISALSDRDFEDLAETFEDAIWYGGNSPRSGRGDAMSGNFEGGEVEDERFLAIRRADQFPPFDIVITFGDMNNAAANHTVQRLVDVSIVNTQFGPIEPDGTPLYVQYDFILRNLM
jgi:hypothetical protein